jgi:hypothetical protein
VVTELRAGEAPRQDCIKLLGERLSAYQSSADPSDRDMVIRAELLLAIPSTDDEELSARRLMDTWVGSTEREPTDAVQLFLDFAIELTVMFGPEVMEGWLARFHQAPLEEGPRLSVSWLRMAIGVIAIDNHLGWPLAPSANPYARMPPELREGLADFAAQVRRLQSLTGRTPPSLPT